MALRKFLILRRPPTGPRDARPEDRLRDHLEGRTNADPANRSPDSLESRDPYVDGPRLARCRQRDCSGRLRSATQARELSTLAPLRVLRARTSDPARPRPVVGEGVRSCPSMSGPP